MLRNAKFWIPMTLFQIIFGVAVFAATRHYYIDDPATVDIGAAVNSAPSLISLDRIRQPDTAPVESSSTSTQTSIQDPVAITRQADDYFAARQFDQAAALYRQLLKLDPDNVETYNNLGITLHYLGRSTEALRHLNQGVAVDPTHQRIWLTLGFVNSKLGNAERARAALTTAAQMNADNAIGQSATKMLEDLN